MTVKIYNLRYGFATNSSSSHSIVYFPNATQVPQGYCYDDSSYGWERFILSEPEEKIRYLLANLVQTHGYSNSKVTQKKLRQIVKECFGVDPNEVLKKTSEADRVAWPASDYEPLLSVDHQSQISIPLKKQLIKDLIELMKDKRVVVFGGNDNGDYMADDFQNHKPVEIFHNLPTDTSIADKSMRYRYDAKAKVHTVFNTVTGFKGRFSTTTGPEGEIPHDYTKAELPELVDLKITNYCPFGCEFCYQSSTAKGRHASLEDVEKTIDALARLNVFEIAIGGGEPTFHPNFIDILKHARKRHIVPNFTTFSTHWLKDENFVRDVEKHVGAIGVSVHTVQDLQKVEEIREAVFQKSWVWSGKVMAQVVLGAHNTPETADIIATANDKHIPLLLLGYKNVGFGADFKYNHSIDDDFSFVFNLLRDAKKFKTTLSVDTAVVNNMPKLMAAINPDKCLVTAEEGKFSMYIDAVENLMGPSSYVPQSEMIPFEADHKEVLQAFRQW